MDRLVGLYSFLSHKTIKASQPCCAFYATSLIKGSIKASSISTAHRRGADIRLSGVKKVQEKRREKKLLKEREEKGEGASSESSDVQEEATRQAAIAPREKHDAPPAYYEVVKA